MKAGVKGELYETNRHQVVIQTTVHFFVFGYLKQKYIRQVLHNGQDLYGK